MDPTTTAPDLTGTFSATSLGKTAMLEDLSHMFSGPLRAEELRGIDKLAFLGRRERVDPSQDPNRIRAFDKALAKRRAAAKASRKARRR